MKIIASAAIIRGYKILLVRKNGRSFWTLPGGKKEDRESNKNCLIRELSEELPRLTIEDVSFLKHFNGTAPQGNYRFKAGLYLTSLNGENIKPGAEIAESKWVSAEILEKYPLSETSLLMIKYLCSKKHLSKRVW